MSERVMLKYPTRAAVDGVVVVLPDGLVGVTEGHKGDRVLFRIEVMVPRENLETLERLEARHE
jgi:hypothetical protein